MVLETGLERRRRVTVVGEVPSRVDGDNDYGDEERTRGDLRSDGDKPQVQVQRS